jgi:hypothetical protein
LATQKKPVKKTGSTKSKTNSKNKNSKKTTIADSTKKQGIVFGTFVFAIFMAAVTFIEAGGIWGHLRNFFFGIFGWSAFIIPFFIIFVSVVAAIGKDTKK